MGETRGDQGEPIEADSPVFETTNGYISLAGGILVVRTKEHQGTEESFAEAIEVIEGLGGGIPRPALWDVRAWKGATSGAWGYLIQRISHIVSAVAMLAPADSPELVGPFPEVIDRLLVPFNVFTDEQEGLDYLADFLHPHPAEE